MYRATRTRFIDMGTAGGRHVRMAMASRSGFERFLVLLLGLVVAIPLLLLVLGLGALVLVVALLGGAWLWLRNRLRAAFGSRGSEPQRRNVRVIRPEDRRPR